jgi:uncharacterized damage-inducible protein DinB
MDAATKSILWQQFGAAVDMLENALRHCPDKLLGDRTKQPEFWYIVYHTLFYLDLYLSNAQEGFAPPAPFTLSEMDPSGPMPERVYTREELLTYLDHGRRKSRAAMAALTDEKARENRKFGSIEGTFLERLLYNMRHVQHHAAQLNLILRQQIDSAPRWVAKAKTPLGPV